MSILHSHWKLFQLLTGKLRHLCLMFCPLCVTSGYFVSVVFHVSKVIHFIWSPSHLECGLSLKISSLNDITSAKNETKLVEMEHLEQFESWAKLSLPLVLRQSDSWWTDTTWYLLFTFAVWIVRTWHVHCVFLVFHDSCLNWYYRHKFYI